MPENCIVRTLPIRLADVLKEALERHCWTFAPLPYARFKAVKEKTSVVLYESGKLVIQGKGAGEFVEFILEPEVLGELAFDPAMQAEADGFAPFTTAHAGMDESGKGDFFGPLVTAAAYVEPEQVAALAKAGVCDCKKISSDARLLQIADEAMKILKGRVGIVIIGPVAYNRMYAQFRSLGPLLAWAHGRALEHLLEYVPDCTEAVADQFAETEETILRALGEKGRRIKLTQRHKAESDMAVAAASVFARAHFLRKLQKLSEEAGITLPKGASSAVDAAAKTLAVRGGCEELAKYGKMHFRTSYRALGLPEPERTAFFRKKN